LFACLFIALPLTPPASFAPAAAFTLNPLSALVNMPLSKEKKEKYFVKMHELVAQYSKCFLVHIDNVGSLQMAKIRSSLRGKGEVLMGKNTMMRKIIGEILAENPDHGFKNILPLIVGNVGFVFANGELGEIKTIIDENRLPAPARVGAISPVDVFCPPGPTGCDPGQTAFFQALQIATKIVKGQIEILTPVKVCFVGEKVGASESALLQKLDIKPFHYGIVIQQVYDNGAIYSPKVLEMTEEMLTHKLINAVTNVAAVALEAGVPSLAALPHNIAKAFNNMVAIAIECEGVTFEKAAPYKAAV